MSDPELVPVGPGLDGNSATEPDELMAEVDAVNAEDASGAPEGATVADIEALLFVAEKPLSRAELRTVAKLSADEIDERLGDLEVQLSERGIRLVSSGDRVMLATAPDSGQLIARYLGADAVRLSPAALETLAIIAYRQPATRGVIERIRGVDSGHVVRGLLHRRLIYEQGRAETPGRPILYGTSMEFMERFGLTSLDDLPPLEAEIAAQLAQAEVDAKEGAADDPTDDEAGDHGAGDDDGSDQEATEPAEPSPDG
jgi:segregation and condensation protein B